jgi:O-antigen/teichoic acid export membrane protein
MAQLVNVGVGSVGFLLSMTNYHNVVLANSILIVAINAGLDLLLIPRFGAVGAAVASGTSIVVSNTVRLAFVGALLKMSPFAGRQTVLVLVTGAAAMLAGMLTLAAASDSALWLGGGLAAAVAIAVYGLGIHMLVERGLVRGIPKLGVLLQRRVHR